MNEDQRETVWLMVMILLLVWQRLDQQQRAQMVVRVESWVMRARHAWRRLWEPAWRTELRSFVEE